TPPDPVEWGEVKLGDAVESGSLNSLPIESEDRLDVRRVRKHVHRLDPRDRVARRHDLRQLARQTLRITRYIDRPRRPQLLEHRIEHHGRTSRPRWIEDDEIGPLARKPSDR